MSPRKPNETDGNNEHAPSQDPRDAGMWDDAASEPFSTDVPRLLLWCNYDPFNAAAVCDHINALAKFSRFDVTVLSQIGSIPHDIDLEQFDAVIIHYSLTLALDSYISVKTRYRLSAYSGLKILFIQDEYRFVEKTRESIRQLGISLVFTCVPAAEIPKIYPPETLPDVTFVNVLTAYVPAWLTVYPAVPLSERKFDVGYRGRDYSRGTAGQGAKKSTSASASSRTAGAPVYDAIFAGASEIVFMGLNGGSSCKIAAPRLPLNRARASLTFKAE